jgi:NADH:ubiquinone reductase (H+-translocating)
VKASSLHHIVAVPRRLGRPRIVIIGCGFGGLNAARDLAGSDVDLLVIDRNNYHGFWPLLYQVATAGLETESIAYPVRAILRDYPNTNFMMAEVEHVDFAARQVHTDSGSVEYDFLVIAAGSANNYFGNPDLACETYGLKHADDAELLRNHVLSAFEHAANEGDPERRRELMTLAVVGGGPTGVELAGAFVELIRHALRHDYPNLDLNPARVVLIEASDKLLAPFPPGLREASMQQLERMGVEVRLNTIVQDVSANLVTFKDGTSLRAGTVVWAAGVRAAELSDHIAVEQARAGRVRVTPMLNLPRYPDVFVVGDMAYLEGYKKSDQAYPMVASVAVQQGKLAARNIKALLAERPLRKFRYFDKGNMATIGRRFAVLDSFGIRLTGMPAWMGWLFVHLMQLVGFRNRLLVLINWAFNYFTYDRGVRLITGIKRTPEIPPGKVREARRVKAAD